MTVAARERRCARLLTQADAVSYFEKYKRVRSTDMKVQQCQSVAFNCDGTKLVCGAFDKKVSVANVDGGRLRFSWVGSSHQSSVEQVACSEKQPNMFASASADRNICVWDIRQSKPTHRISNKVGNFFISWSPCDSYFIFLDKENRLQTVDVRNYEVVNTHDMKIFSHELAFHPISNHVFVAESSGRVEILKFAGGSLEPVTFIQAHSHQVDCLALSISKDGRRLAVGASDASCSIWDLEELICERVIPRHDYGIRAVSFSCNGQLLASGSEDHSIDIAYVPDGSRCHEIKHNGETFSVTWHPHSLLLAYTASSNGDKSEGAFVKTFGHSTV
ncbi:unnamed protein product [Caenorhabditis sp. 36 PRJEB53466]|nr:unnamed protein product [Caenorhabditis sp. 36 PRJEB53466]